MLCNLCFVDVMSLDSTVHIPVLRDEALDMLLVRPGMCVIDATLGGGGYTLSLLERVGEDGQVIACDADEQAIARFRAQYPEESDRVTLIHANYAFLAEALDERGITQIDCIVADLGLSSDQIERGARGFAFKLSGPIDMRLDATSGETAADIIERFSVEDLAEAFRLYGDERHALLAARAIKEQWPLETTDLLAGVIMDAIGKYYRSAKIHPATRIFQALRIVVNREYEQLEKFLTRGIEMLVPEGRMSIVTFHSGEDRIVKNIFRESARGCICPPELPVCRCENTPTVKRVTRKPVTPTEKEVKDNPRARSAKLRVIEKLGE